MIYKFWIFFLLKSVTIDFCEVEFEWKSCWKLARKCQSEKLSFWNFDYQFFFLVPNSSIVAVTKFFPFSVNVGINVSEIFTNFAYKFDSIQFFDHLLAFLRHWSIFFFPSI